MSDLLNDAELNLQQAVVITVGTSIYSVLPLLIYRLSRLQSDGRHSAAAQALSLLELQDLFFQPLLRDAMLADKWGSPGLTEQQKDVVSVALACRAFLETALDVRWRSIPCLTVLLDVWRAAGVVEGSHYPVKQYVRYPVLLDKQVHR